MQPIIRFTLLTALRDLLFIGLLAVLLMAMGVSFFMGGTALTEQKEMSLSYLAGSSRLIVITGLVLFVCFHVKRAFDNKEIDVILSRPISRTAFVCSYWIAFAVLTLVILIPTFAAICAFTSPNSMGMLYWAVSLAGESFIVIAFALVSSLILKSAVTAALSSLGFYLLSRMMGFFVASISVSSTWLPTWANFGPTWVMETVVKIVSFVLPRLDLFAKTEWLLYGNQHPHDWLVIASQSVIYVPFMLALAIFDFRRKQF